MTSVTWHPMITLPAAKAADSTSLDALLQEWRIQLPASLRELILQHGGEQVQPSMFWCQNTRNGKWKQDAMGVLYHCRDLPDSKTDDSDIKNDDDDDDDDDLNSSNMLQSFHIKKVNELFAGDMTNPDDEDGGDGDSSSSLPLFAFSESPSSGHLLCLDPHTGYVLVLDVTRRKGPWVAATNWEAFWQGMIEEKERGKGELEEDDEDEDDEHDGAHQHDHGDDGEYNEDDDDESESYCCDVCLVEIPANAARWHCDTCSTTSFDLCQSCKLSIVDGVASQPTQGRRANIQHANKSHPKNHVFSLIQNSSSS